MSNLDANESDIEDFLPVTLKTDYIDKNGKSVNLIETLIPYLMMGFIPTHGGDWGQDSFLYALMTSFNSARRPLGLISPDSPPEDDNDQDEDSLLRIDKSQATTLSQWKSWIGTAAFRRYMEELCATSESWLDLKDKLGEEEWQKMFDRLCTTHEDQSWERDQMSCLLKVANEIYGTNFELGIIMQGDATGYPKQTELQVNDIEAIDRPVIWMIYNHKNYRYLTNRVEPPVKQPIFTRWSGFAFHEDVQFNDNGEDSASISMDMRRTQVLEFGIGKRVEKAAREGLYVLTKNYGVNDSDNTNHRACRGAFLTPEPSAMAKDGTRGMVTVTGQPIIVKESDIQKIELHRSAPASDTDDRNTVREGICGYIPPEESEDKTQKDHPNQPLPGPGSLRQETDSELSDLDNEDFRNEEAGTTAHPETRVEDNVTFYRVLNPSKRLLPVLYLAQMQDPVFLEEHIEGFEVKTCDILLDLHQPRRIRNGLLTTRVRNIHGKEGWVWTRRLQKLENCWNLRRRYSQLRSIGELQRMLASESVEELLHRAEDRGLDLDGVAENLDSTTELIDRILEDMEGEQQWHHLKVYQINRDGGRPSCDDKYPVDYEKFELIVQDEQATDAADLNIQEGNIGVRDIDGQLGVLEKKRLDHVTDNGWGLRLYHPSSLFRKRPKDDSHWRKPRDDGGDDNESVLSDVQLSYKRDPLDPPARAVEKKKASPKGEGKGKFERKDDGDDDEDRGDDSPSAGGGKAGTKKPAAKKTGGKKAPSKKPSVKKPAAGKKGNRNSDSTITQNEDDQEDEVEEPVKKKIKKSPT